ncbi:MAG: hypothetical protein EPO23_08065 [Xanthobacteraceae bacterium]|nr:MAG: hypothetical protein EPO23_08065 [Xanthobacteraceae bacterium]
MTYIVTFHWGWMLGALLLGLAMGWVAVVQRGEGLSVAAFRRLAALVAVALVAALARLVPGQFGYWLDLAMMLLIVYLAGCSAGSALRGALIARHHANKAV